MLGSLGMFLRKISAFVPPESLLTSEESMWERNLGAPQGKAPPVLPLLVKGGDHSHRLPFCQAPKGKEAALGREGWKPPPTPVSKQRAEL